MKKSINAVVKTPINKRGGRISKEKKKDIMLELQEIIEDGTILGLTKTHLAKRFNTKRETITKYMGEVYALIPPEDINNVRVKIQTMFDKLFREVKTMLVTASNKREKKEAIDLMLRMMDKFQDFLERFGLKPKAEENINVNTSSIQLNINMDMKDFKQIQELESRRL